MVQTNQTESSIINSLKDIVDKDNQNVLGWNEDAVAVKLENGFLVLNTDSWVGSTDKPDDLSYFDCGYRALVNSASDVIAKGSKPEYAVVSLSIPDDTKNEVKEIISGIVKACDDYNLHYLGGDMNSATDIVIDVTIWGFTKSNPIRRDGACIGDNVYWLGPDFGETSAALGILVNSWKGDKSMALRIYGRPVMFLDFIGTKASSAIDCSDGLAKSLYFICEMSNVGIEIDSIDCNAWVNSVAKDNKIDLLDLIFHGGEELGIIFTSASNFDSTKNFRRIGKVVSGEVVTYMGKKIDNRGWEHFN
ncbi:MAG: thiamine-monophosphate kinase [Candidatus Heimdallarchaeota archaeon]|nr:thiamine-monophosphate kinase [Candidatus Heimdallarchaeota archaeon]